LHRATKLTPEQIALVEPLVIGAHGVERAALKKGEPVVIVGMGQSLWRRRYLQKPPEQISFAWTCKRIV